MQKVINLLQKNISDFWEIRFYIFLYIGINILNIILEFSQILSKTVANLLFIIYGTSIKIT